MVAQYWEAKSDNISGTKMKIKIYLLDVFKKSFINVGRSDVKRAVSRSRLFFKVV